MNVKKLAVAIPQAGDTTLFDIDVSNYDLIGVEVKNSGAQVFDAFKVFGKTHPGGDEITIASVGTDYTAPDGKFMLKASGDLTILAAAAVGWLLLDIRALHRLRMAASCGNVAGTTANVYGVSK